MSRRLTFFLLAGLMLGTVLLIQRSLTTYYAYQSSELEQEKKVMVKQIKALEVELRRTCRPEVLYHYWAENREKFDFDLPNPNRESFPLASKKVKNEFSVTPKSKTRFTRLGVSP